MRKEDLSVPAILAEAIEIVIGIVYIGLQIYYGVAYHVPAYKFICNIIGLLLVYAALTIMSNHPERINRLLAELCVGAVRKYTLRMLRLVKLVFVVGLMIPCVWDVAGLEMKEGYSLIIPGLILLIAGIYEYKILLVIRKNRGDKK